MSVLGDLLEAPFWEQLGDEALVVEHGDPSMADYAAKYHPGYDLHVSPTKALTMLGRDETPNIPPDAVHDLLVHASTRKRPLDLSQVEVNGTQVWGNGLGIAREQMPSLPSEMRDKFFEDLRAHARTWIEATDPRQLRPMQGEIDATKVGAMYLKLLANTLDAGESIASRDGYILDGHHRWGAGIARTFRQRDTTQPVIHVDMDAQDLLAFARQWTEANGVAARKFGESGDVH